MERQTGADSIRHSTPDCVWNSGSSYSVVDMNFELKRYTTSYVAPIHIPGKHGVCYWTQQPIRWIDTSNISRIIPAGIVSDGYSIPPILRGLIRGLKSDIPGFVHDWQFWTQEAGTLKLTNKNLYKGIIQTKSGRYNACKVCVGLWIGGWIAWNRYKGIMAEKGYNAVIESHIAKTYEEALKIATKGAV